MIGSGRDKIETPEQLKKAADTVRRLELDGLVVCGGDDSNTNAAVLAEYFLVQGAPQLVLEKVPLVLGQASFRIAPSNPMPQAHQPDPVYGISL